MEVALGNRGLWKLPEAARWSQKSTQSYWSQDEFCSILPSQNTKDQKKKNEEREEATAFTRRFL